VRSKPAAMPGVFKYRKMHSLAKKRGLSNRSLAAKVHANQGTVGRWAKGEAAPSPKFIARLAEVLEVQPSELYVVSEADQNLSYYRVLAGYSLAQLAPLLGTSSVHLGRMETGRSSIPPKFLDKLRELLNIDDDTLNSAVTRSQKISRRRQNLGRYELIPNSAPRELIGA
jgi:transcriptional regulator with XRE-family HTH domain